MDRLICVYALYKAEIFIATPLFAILMSDFYFMAIYTSLNQRKRKTSKKRAKFEFFTNFAELFLFILKQKHW